MDGKLKDSATEALEFIRALRSGTADEAIDLLTNNVGEDVEGHLAQALAPAGVAVDGDPPYETPYLDLLRNIMQNGDERMDRTGVGTKSIFGAMMRFDLRDNKAPILTTKKVAWATAIREMLWFLSGNANIRELVSQGVHIWTDWPLKAYREATGDKIDRDEFERRIINDQDFAAEWGGGGRGYGAQWRGWAGPNGLRIDQVANVIDMLRHSPTSRRILFHAWNPAEIDLMLLPPCHLLYQFHVSQGRYLNCCLYQRSCDVFLGLGFNLVGATALVHMLAKQTGFAPGELVWMGGDVHLYLNHFDQAREQLSREPRSPPRLFVRDGVPSIDDYKIEDFIVSDYDPHPAIRAPVAV